jgi:hypothetical protein
MLNHVCSWLKDNLELDSDLCLLNSCYVLELHFVTGYLSVVGFHLG